jgi:hypothetical protein
LLENPQPTQHQVDIFRYPNGEQVIANGNTRSWVWKELMKGKMEHQVPDKVFATIYDVKNKKEAEDLYYTMDSQSSVEKTNDIITGIYRKLGFLNTLVNQKIKRGYIIKSLEFAAKNKPYFDKDEYRHNKPAAFGKIVLDFKDEILTLDAINPKYAGSAFDTHITCAALMALNRYATDPVKTQRLISGLQNISNDDRGPVSKSKGADGITFLLMEYDKKKIFQKRPTDDVSMPEILDFVLYCLEKWIDGANIKKYAKPSPEKGKGCRKSIWETYWK